MNQVYGVSDVCLGLCESVGGGLKKRSKASLPVVLSWRKLSPSSCLDARHLSSSFYVTGAFQGATPVLELRGSESEQVSPSR